MKRFSTAVLLAGLIGVGLSCGGDGPTMSGPGDLKVRLTSPNSGLDTAIVFTITGPAALTTAVAAPGLRLFQQPLGGTSTRFALIGKLDNNATILTIGVQDLGALSQYHGSITGVAVPSYALRVLPGGYALAVLR